MVFSCPEVLIPGHSGETGGKPPGLFLRILSRLYALGVYLVRAGYRSGIRRVHKAPIAVVSVGNLTLGGTGKTPMTIFIADHFTASKRKPAVLTRGYGNDECRMLADELPEVPVYKGQDRVKNVLKAARDGRDVAILDDGFQHRRLARDLNILLVDARAPFGNGFIFPAGALREPHDALRRADMVVITKVDGFTPEEIRSIKERVAAESGEKPVMLSRHLPVSFRDLTGSSYGLDVVEGRKVCLVCGIADPLYLDSIMARMGCVVEKKFFYPDHYKYRQEDLDEISRYRASSGIDNIVTTRKDLVKMRDLDMSGIEDISLALNIQIDITEGKESLIAGLDSVFRDTSA